MKMEAEEEAERLSEQFKSEAFLHLLPHGKEGMDRYKAMFPEKDEFEVVEEEVTEVMPESEEEFRLAANEMLRMGLIKGVAQ